VKRTTILADEDLLAEARYLATQKGMTLTDLIHEALREYIRAHQSPRRISFTGLGHSGEPRLWHGEDEILANEVTPTAGWAPPLPRLPATREQSRNEDQG
jgi:hypothetical protein